MRLLGLALVALVAACGGNAEPQQAAADTTDMAGTAASDPAADHLPAGFTPYPGAQVVTANVIAAGNGGGGVIMVMQTADTPAQVIAFYRAQAEAAGVTVTAEARTDTTTAFNGDGPGGLGVAVSAATGPQGVTLVQLTAGSDG